MCRPPNFARACGRVPVGGHPDKRPDSRPEQTPRKLPKSFGRLSSEPLNRQPEAKPAHPALNGGRGLKQRRSGLLWSRRPSKGRHRRGLSILAGRAERVFPLQAKAASRVEEPVACRPCLHRTARRRPSPADAGRFAFARISIRAARLIEPGEESAMNTRIRDFLRTAETVRTTGPASSSISMSSARTISASPRRCPIRAFSTP